MRRVCPFVAGRSDVGHVRALGSRDAQSLIDAARKEYFIVDNQVLVLTGGVLRISFDGCGSFVRWNPRTLPKATIDRAELPAFCAPQGTMDCSRDDYDFDGDREPLYSDIRVTPGGMVSFTVRSRSFKPEGVLGVSSDDFGRTWRVEP